MKQYWLELYAEVSFYLLLLSFVLLNFFITFNVA